jgi:caffeoyl-CoA O-methyltransferase
MIVYAKATMITDPQIEHYMMSVAPARDAVLSEIEAYAAEHNVPIVGPLVGRFLAALVMISRSKRIFELGSAIGYSTIWLARAAGPDAEVHYSDGSEANAARARQYFERAGVASRTHVHVGDALTALAATGGPFDMIFNDVNKDGYPAVLDAVPQRIKTGGLFVSDNTLWSGRVLDPKEASDHGVCDFNKRLFASADFYPAQLPVRDGVTIAIRL